MHMQHTWGFTTGALLHRAPSHTCSTFKTCCPAWTELQLNWQHAVLSLLRVSCCQMARSWRFTWNAFQARLTSQQGLKALPSSAAFQSRTSSASKCVLQQACISVGLELSALMAVYPSTRIRRKGGRERRRGACSMHACFLPLHTGSTRPVIHI